MAWFENKMLHNIRPIAYNVNEFERILPYLQDAAYLDILPAIGAEEYQKLDTATDLSEFQDLLTGCYYTDCNGNLKYHNGLYTALAFLAYARFVRNNQINVTAFGVVNKQSQYSTPINETNLIRHSQENENIGREYLRQTLDYLNETCCTEIESHLTRTFRLSVIEDKPQYDTMIFRFGGWL